MLILQRPSEANRVSPQSIPATTVHSPQKQHTKEPSQIREKPGKCPSTGSPYTSGCFRTQGCHCNGTPDTAVVAPGSGLGHGVRLRTSLPAASSSAWHRPPGIAPSAHRTASAPDAGRNGLHSPEGRRLTARRRPARQAQDRGRNLASRETGSKMAMPEIDRK